MKKIGFIGLGVMGSHMSKNLLKAGYSVTVWNRTRSKMQDLVSLGAQQAVSPKEVAQKSDVVIVMVGDSPDVEEVVLGAAGIIEGCKPNLIVVNMSSTLPESDRKIAEVLNAKGVKMLDAPVSGGETGAREATLSIMVGGPEDAYNECLPIFSTLGKTITRMGDLGSGQATKLCNQVICAMHIQAVCEGLTFGARLGLDLKKLLSVVTAGYANSRILSDLGPKMASRDFRPGFKMRHQLKDLNNALETAANLKLPLPCTAVVSQMFRGVEAMGLEEEGTQASILVMQKLAGEALVKDEKT